MKKILIVLFLLISIVVNSATYYVATTGSDAAAGTIAAPFATWEKGFSVLSAGDILYIFVNNSATTESASTQVHISWSNRSGTVSDSIFIYAYPGEVPIFNLDNIVPTSTWHTGLLIQNCDYLHIEGLRVTGLPQYSNANIISASYMYDLTHSLIENCSFDNCGGYGVQMEGTCNYVTFKNCDAHHNGDPYNAYENGNGFNITGGVPVTNITFIGCRAWKNGDDGWDFLDVDTYITMDKCWGFWNGYDDSFNILGDGQGFKLGPFDTHQPTTLKRVITNCIAAKNGGSGFDQNPWTRTAIMHLYNNTSYDNKWLGFSFNDISGIANVLTNNISYANDNANGYYSTGNILTTNSWQISSVSDADFVDLTMASLDDARQANGNLPDITTLHLVSASDMVDVGTDVGIAYEGAAPDLGAFEYVAPGGGGEIAPTVTTALVTNVTTATASGGGTVTDDGGAAVSARGVCWATSSNPTTAGSHTTDGAGTGAFTSSITGLVKNTTYYVRAYATNSEGTSYGANVSFRTPGYLIVIY